VFPLKDENPTELTPFVTLLLIGVNVAVWLLVQQGGLAEPFVESLCLYGAIPAKVTGQLPVDASVVLGEWRCPPGGLGLSALVTSMFLHGGWMHLVGNMWFLWVFGNNIEDSMGHLRFIAFYLLTGLVAAGAHVLTDPGSTIPVVGASGAISGVMGGYLLLYPKVKVHTLVFLFFFVRVVLLPAGVWLGLWFALQLIEAAAGRGGGVAFWAHIGGFLAGLAGVRLFARRKLVEAKRQHRVLRRDELGPWERW
jgi:membrane associated rhomboid family serine protease